MFLFICAAFAEPFTEYVAADDGTALASDVFLPVGDGPWATVLIRTPYGKGGLGDTAELFNAYGLAVVAQDVRGRFESDGIDTVFQDAGRDGRASIEWITTQDWSNGDVAMWGPSALSITQYLAAPEAPEDLKVVLTAAGTGDLYEDVYFPQGTFREGLVTGWLGAQGSLGWLDEIYEHPRRDGWWDTLAADHAAVRADGVHIAGWYDIFRDGTIGAWQQQSTGTGEQWLIIGPWTHNGLGSRDQGELVYPAVAEDAPVPMNDLALRVLFAALGLEGLDAPDDIPRVQYFVMGDPDAETGNVWREADSWPPESTPTRWYLGPEGTLSTDCPDGGTSTWQYNPANPAPTICGANLVLDAGPCDQAELDLRNDTLLFATEPLAAPTEITGQLSAHFFVEVDQPDAEIHVRVVDIYPDGRRMLLSDAGVRMAASEEGLVALEEGVSYEVDVDLGATSIVVHAGHSIGLYVGSANWPRFGANRNTGVEWGEMDEVPGNVLTVTMSHDELTESYLELPIPGADPFTECPLVEENENIRRSPEDNCGCSPGAPAAPLAGVLIAALWVRTRREYGKA